jgi:putative Mg2+ transporter-C (MgtC) family protein
VSFSSALALASTLPISGFFLRLVFCAFLGALIGFERQWHHRVAGLQTNVLVACGAFLFVALTGMTTDPQSLSRVAAQVVSGIGFLGAGVIMRNGLNIHGINTAATLWCSAAIGVLCGANRPLEAALAAAFLVVVNAALRGLSWRLTRHLQNRSPLPAPYRLVLRCPNADVQAAREALCAFLAARNDTIWRMGAQSGPDGRGYAETFADCRVSESAKFHRELLDLEIGAREWMIEWELQR